jgi:hypothetical protein
VGHLASINDIVHYTHSLDRCEAAARTACSAEIAALWISIGSSYRFLLEREARLDAENRHTGTERAL